MNLTRLIILVVCSWFSLCGSEILLYNVSDNLVARVQPEYDSNVKSMASDFTNQLHNKSNFSPSPTVLTLLPFQFNATSNTNMTLSPFPFVSPISPSFPPQIDTNNSLVTSFPTLANFTTMTPSEGPSISPITDRPSFSPSEALVVTPIPSKAPTETPSFAVTLGSTTTAPTPVSTEETPPTDPPYSSLPPSNGLSTQPSSAPSLSTTSYSPTRGFTAQPVTKPTKSPTVPRRVFGVPTEMTFYNSNRLKGEVLDTWIRVTSERIKKFTLISIEAEQESVSGISVDLEITEQNPQGGRIRMRGLTVNSVQAGAVVEDVSPKRRLQSSTPLTITYITHIEFNSNVDTWNSTEFVADGFTTPDQQRSYILQLKASDLENFQFIERVTMEVNGTVVTEDSIPDQQPNNENNFIYYVVGAVGGALLLAILLALVCSTRKGSRRKINSGDSEVGVHTSEGSRKAETGPTPPQSSSYFGTIESREGDQDDVSTLGDPYFGEAINAVMDRDDTVADSGMFSSQDLFAYGVGRPRLDTGASSSRMDTTITGTSNMNKMIFNDDNALEDVYRTPECTSFDQEDSKSERLTVIAPAGKLGIVIDNPGGDIPVVHAIKDTSVLVGRVKVGDLLISMDEVDCCGMSAVGVSKLISSRSDNPTRTFVMLRGAAGSIGGLG